MRALVPEELDHLDLAGRAAGAGCGEANVVHAFRRRCLGARRTGKALPSAGADQAGGEIAASEVMEVGVDDAAGVAAGQEGATYF